jgi:hypothetical protein
VIDYVEATGLCVVKCCAWHLEKAQTGRILIGTRDSIEKMVFSHTEHAGGPTGFKLYDLMDCYERSRI